MSADELKTGKEILDEYFQQLSENPEVSEEIRRELLRLWKENKLSTKTSLVQALDAMRQRQVRNE